MKQREWSAGDAVCDHTRQLLAAERQLRRTGNRRWHERGPVEDKNKWTDVKPRAPRKCMLTANAFSINECAIGAPQIGEDHLPAPE